MYGEEKEGIGFSIILSIIFQFLYNYWSRRCTRSLFPVINLPKHTYWRCFPNCRWVWKDLKERTSGIRRISRLGRFQPPYSKLPCLSSETNPFSVKYVYVCVHAYVYIYVRVFVYVFFHFLRKGQKKSNSCFHALKMQLFRVTWVFIPDQQSDAVWDLTELPQ